MMPSIPQLIILLVLFLLILLPIILVAKSDMVKGGEKALWVVAAVLFSWIGYIAFMISVRNKHQAKTDQDQ